MRLVNNRAGAAKRLSTKVLALVLAFCFPLWAGCSSSSAPKETPKAKPTTTPTPSKTPLEPITFTMAFTGDVLSHNPVTQASKQKDGTYRYDGLTTGIKDYISAATIAVHHQEIPYGVDNNDVHGYPVFSAPPSWLDSVKELGYDAMTTASNHTIDKGKEGAIRTLELAEQHGLAAVGSNKSETQDPIQYYQLKKGNHTIKVAHLSNAYGTNFGEHPVVLEQNPWLMQGHDPDHMIELAKKARAAGAQVVMLSTHDGTEYQTTPSDQQRAAAKKYAESGLIDFVITHHAHVPEPIEKLDGGVDGKGMWIYWGLGNMLTSMNHHLPYTQLSVLAMVTVKVDSDDKVTVEQAGWQGFILDRPTLRIATLDKIDQARKDGFSMPQGKVDSYAATLKKIVGDQATLLQAPPEPQSDLEFQALPRK